MKPIENTAWLTERMKLLEAEKAHVRAADELAAARRALPPVPVTKTYAFDGPDGPETLADLFGDHSQLAVYHFMYGPDWEAGCPSCSFWADNLDGVQRHLAARDVSLVMVASAPYATLAAYNARMGWSHRWSSAARSDFSEDFGVRFPPKDLEAGRNVYNYREGGFGGPEAPGLSAFYRDGEGRIFYQYSTYARGLDRFNGAYQLLDLMPKGRDEDALPYGMAWLKRRDEYEGGER